jgi:hypothetical protein
MRIGVDAGMAWTRMVLAERRLGWLEGVRGSVLACQLALAAALVAGLLAPSWTWRATVWCVAIATQIPAWRSRLSHVAMTS